MKRTEQSVRKVNIFNQGADSDTNEKILGATSTQKYIDARNVAVRGRNDKILKFVGGEQLVHGALDSTWECIGSYTVNGHLVEVWVDQMGTITRFRIDGIVMVETDQLNFDANHPLQGDTNDRCDGGELYTTDNKNPIYIFNIQDIIDNYNAGSDTYFSGFNPVNYQAVLKTSPHHPVYVALDTISGGGLTTGKYNYSIRYSDDTGNKTSWSVQTPNIPVPANVGLASLQHPGIKTYGGATSLLTNYGIRLRFRIDNVGGYQYVEIRRVAHNDGQPLNYIPTPEYLKLITDASGATVDIVNNPFQIVEWVDSAALNGEWQELSDEEDTIAISGSFTAKTLRYYQNRLVPMNITYPSRDLSGIVPDMFIVKNNKLGFPVIEKLTTDIDRLGFQSIDNQVRYPHLPTGEKYGWGIYFMDDYGSRSFVAPCDDLVGHDLKNFQMPNRREPLSADTLDYSVTQWKGAPVAATINSNNGLSTGYVHEVYDLVGARAKTDICGFKNIMNKGAKRAGKVNNAPFSDCDPGPVTNNIDTGFINEVLAKDLGHLPFRPINDGDGNVTGHNFRINTSVMDVLEGNDNNLPVNGSSYDYSPQGFAPNYYSHGLALWGIKNKPDWARAFSIVRTKPAGRLVAQGVGFWKLKTDSTGATSKETNRMLLYSPDLDSNLTGGVSMQQIIDNPAAYSIQLVSPVGAFTEVYDGEKQDIRTVFSWWSALYGAAGDIPYNRGIDMAIYARQFFEAGGINPSYSASAIGHGDGYVSYGRWLNSVSSGNGQAPLWDTYDGNHIFDINTSIPVSIDAGGANGRSNMLDISTTEQFWVNAGINNAQFAAKDPKFWGEPFYIVNIIRKDVDVPYGNINQYIETGNLQKFDSRIGISNGNNSQSYPLVDERWEDCIPNALSQNYVNENRYVYVDGARWLNVVNKPAAYVSVVLNSLQSTGSYFVTDTDIDGNPTQVEIFGVCTSTGIPGTDIDFTIEFSYFNSNYNVEFFVPAQGMDISIKYDNRVPIKIFAGDAVIAENSFVPYDRTSNASSDNQDQLMLCTGVPYQMYSIPNRVYLVADTTQGNKVQDDNDIFVKNVRQILVNFIGESRVNIPLLYGDRYPHIHYVMRPHRWKQGSEDDPAAFLAANNMDFGGGTPYYDDYGYEWNNWIYGGFHFIGSTNVDYQKILNDRTNASRPVVGFQEKTRFCTRIIWSNKRSINEQDDPNLRSFPSLNIFDISDAYGEIKYAYDNDSEKGNNLFAVTDHGISLMVTDKRILSDFTGTEIANLKTDTGFIQGEYWLSKEIGSTGEMWRGIAEYNNQMFLPNINGVYLLSGLSLNDILRGGVSGDGSRGMSGYRTKLLPYLRGILPGYATPMCAAYDQENNEYLLSIGSLLIPTQAIDNPEGKPVRTSPTTFIFSNDPGKIFWSGHADYNFQKMVYLPKYLNVSEGRIIGLRDYQAYRLGVGTTINGIPAIKQLIYSVCPIINQTMEFIDGTVNSNVKPTRLEFAHTLSAIPECSLLAPVIRDYTNSFYFMVPRKDASPNDRLQNDSFIVRVTHDAAADFAIISIETGHKPIKW